MHLASDYVHPLPGRGRCRVRIYLPEAEDELMYDDAPVVVCSEVAGNAGPNVTEQAERVAAEVMTYHRMDRAPVWIEHWPPEATDGRAETFELVVFSHHEVREIARAARVPSAGDRDLSLYLDRDAEGQLCHANRRTRVRAGLRSPQLNY